MKFLSLIVDLSRSQYTVEDVPTLAQHIARLAVITLSALLTLLTQFSQHYALIRVGTFITLTILANVLAEVARNPESILTHLAVSLADRLVISQMKMAYA